MVCVVDGVDVDEVVVVDVVDDVVDLVCVVGEGDFWVFVGVFVDCDGVVVVVDCYVVGEL